MLIIGDRDPSDGAYQWVRFYRWTRPPGSGRILDEVRNREQHSFLWFTYYFHRTPIPVMRQVIEWNKLEMVEMDF
jgi:hypothetical protein